MVSSLPKKSIAIAGLAAIAALVALALVLIAGKTDASPVAPPAESLSVLAPATPSAVKEVPQAAQPWLAMIQAPSLAGAPVSEVGVATMANGDQVIVASAGSDICFYEVRTASSNCGNADRVANGQIFTATPSGCEGYAVVGLVPDGVNSLAVATEAGASDAAKIPVVSNAYTATLGSTQTTLSGGDVRINLPLDSYAAENEGC
jgi:hypothetical protein